MPTNIGQDGAFETDYMAPFGGLNVQQPANIMQDNYTPAVSNFIFRNAELRSRWPYVPKFATPPPSGTTPGLLGGPILGQASFVDVNGTTHTVFWNDNQMFQLVRSGTPGNFTYSWQQIPGMLPVATGIPMAYQAFGNCLFFTNGPASPQPSQNLVPHLQMWDGVLANMSNPDPSGINENNQAIISGDNFGWTSSAQSPAGVNICGRYLAELADHMLMAYITAADPVSGLNAVYPQRLWWSSTGYAVPAAAGTFPAGKSAWDITLAGTGGGWNDFLDTPDNITGLATVGIQGYLFRQNGISQFFPTGNGQLPFSFDHLWASYRGIGAAYPWSIAAYGPNLCFVAFDNIYEVGINSWQPIGGLCRDAIMADLYTSFAQFGTTGQSGQIVSSPVLEYVYLGYLIAMPLANGMKFYFYAFEDQNWTSWFVPNQTVTAPAQEVWI